MQNTVGSSQVPSLQIAASQAQGGVFFQGNGSQVFQMNVESSQLKGTYQLHGALYQGAIPATFITTANGNKTASPNTRGGDSSSYVPYQPLHAWYCDAYSSNPVKPARSIGANNSNISISPGCQDQAFYRVIHYERSATRIGPR